MRLLRWWVPAVAALSLACGGPKESSSAGTTEPPAASKDPKTGPTDNPKEPKKPLGIDIPKTVNASSGQATRSGPPPKRAKLWVVRWKGARLDFGEEGAFSGFMDRVTGSFFDATGKEASTFQSEKGEAVKNKPGDKSTDALRLSGRVKIVSREHRATMFCDKVEYQPAKKLIRALGHVRIETENGVLDAGNEVLASADLRHVATPNLF